VVAALEVSSVLVVTAPAVASDFESLGARVLLDAGGGLNASIGQGIAAAGGGPVAVLLGDLPALRGSELATALKHAERHPRAFVADADDDGTVLITALDAADHTPAFGTHSRAAHLALGYLELNFAVDSGLRRDVDALDQLTALASRVGPRTLATLAAP